MGKQTSCHLISVDEKTGIQALKRIAEGQDVHTGKCRRIEYEYERKGTICLMAAIEVGRGKIVHHRLNDTRNEEDFLIFVRETVRKFPAHHEIIFMADQLNTHMSASLVEWVANEIGFKGSLGKKKYRGILKSMKTRKQFLENPQHRIRFIYTPKHCSWLNPIENWFAKLQNHVIRYGDFASIEDLCKKIVAYIEYYNDCLSKPLKWKFKGFTKNKKFNYFKT